MTAEKTNSKINFELEKARLMTLVAETDFIDTLSKEQKNYTTSQFTYISKD